MKTFKQHLTELSKSTLGSYVKKAVSNIDATSWTAGGGRRGPRMTKLLDKVYKRTNGVSRAVDKLTKEEVEQVDELSKGTLGSYVKKAGVDASHHKANAYGNSDTLEKFSSNLKRAHKRQRGIEKAVDKLTKEETVLEVAGEHGHMSDAAHELVLHADNDSHLYHSSHLPIVKNLHKKMKKGIYNPEKAKKLWGYHADRAAQNYHKHYGDKSQPWHKMFTTADRKQAAAHWEHHHRDGLNEDKHDDRAIVKASTYDKLANRHATRATNSGKANKQDVSALKNRLKFDRKYRSFYPKPHLPEEVEQNENTSRD